MIQNLRNYFNTFMIMIDFHSIKKIFRRENALKILFQFMIDVAQKEQVMSSVQDVERKEVNIVELI